MSSTFKPFIPAEAGTQALAMGCDVSNLGPRFRGDERILGKAR